MRRKSEAHHFSPKEKLDQSTSFFMVGIGGSGMAPIAKILKKRGHYVHGTDRGFSKNVQDLNSLGIDVTIGHSGKPIRPGDVVILSDAIWLESSPEFSRAIELGCLLYRRSQVLGWLLKKKKTIAVTGTHGKTTCTALTASVLKSAGLDPFIIVGADVPALGGSVVMGEGDWAVVEACEAYDGYHDLDPTIVFLTNLEADHLDYHENYESLFQSMLRFVQKIPAEGCLIYCKEDKGASEIAKQFNGRKFGYDSSTLSQLVPDIKDLKIPGAHNRLNAGGVLLVANQVGLDLESAADAISDYRGAKRRMEIHLDGPVIVMDDYGHHPTEIRETIKALRERYPERRIVFVFQPQLYSRTMQFRHEFAEELSKADHVVITDIFASREEPMPGVSALHIAELITKPMNYVPCRHLLPRFLKSMAKPGDLIIGSGVGNIGEMGPLLAAEFKRSGPTKVAVIYGGDNEEREVSLHSGKMAYDALQSKGYDVVMVDIAEQLLTRGDLSFFVGPDRPDVVFLATHGERYEDGAIEGLFELLHLPYTHSNIRASTIAWDKQFLKQFLAGYGLPVTPGILLKQFPKQRPDLSLPLVVKPNDQGSTIGVYFVDKEEDLMPAIQKAFRYSNEILVERWLKGMEITVPVFAGHALPIVEIIPSREHYDFESKYLPGGAEEIVPARISDEIAEKVRSIATQAYEYLDCSGVIRVDMIIEDEMPYILEVNTIPGMTPTSLLPASIKASPLSFADLCEMLVEESLGTLCAEKLDILKSV